MAEAVPPVVEEVDADEGDDPGQPRRAPRGRQVHEVRVLVDPRVDRELRRGPEDEDHLRGDPAAQIGERVGEAIDGRRRAASPTSSSTPMRRKKKGMAKAIGSGIASASSGVRPRCERAQSARTRAHGKTQVRKTRVPPRRSKSARMASGTSLQREALGRGAGVAVLVADAEGHLGLAVVRVLHELELDGLHLVLDARDDVGIGLAAEGLRRACFRSSGVDDAHSERALGELDLERIGDPAVERGRRLACDLGVAALRLRERMKKYATARAASGEEERGSWPGA